MIKSDLSLFDVLYGFIPLTEWEQKIIDCPFFQRLRWIKQLGFANYIFPGAEHNRFSHVIGVMHSMDQMIRALGLAVSDEELFDPKKMNSQALFHKNMRIAALLHDIGTFPFSHAIEYAYIRHGKAHSVPIDLSKAVFSSESSESKVKPVYGDLTRSGSHEGLGAFIIQNTHYAGGITRILDDYGFDVKLISQIIQGESPDFIANQLMHSDVDADRMDYLMRDAHYTGMKYGQFDREYLLANLVTYSHPSENSRPFGGIGFGIREKAIHTVEDFLIARFSWYSQVIKNPGSAKFDILASHITEAFLNQKLMYCFSDLLDLIEDQDEKFFWWNDLYFMNRLQEVKFQKLTKDPKTLSLLEMLLYRRPPKTLKHPLFSARLISNQVGHSEKETLIDQIRIYTLEIEKALKDTEETNWFFIDIPEKDVTFTKNLSQLSKTYSSETLLKARDSVRVVSRTGQASLLVERNDSLIKHLSNFINFAPSLYASPSAIKILEEKHLLLKENL